MCRPRPTPRPRRSTSTRTAGAQYRSRYYFADGPEADGPCEQDRGVPRPREPRRPGTLPLMRVYYANDCGWSHDELAVGKERFNRDLQAGRSAAPWWSLLWTGITGPTTLVVEALDTGCPYQGHVSPQAIPPHHRVLRHAAAPSPALRDARRGARRRRRRRRCSSTGSTDPRGPGTGARSTEVSRTQPPQPSSQTRAAWTSPCRRRSRARSCRSAPNRTRRWTSSRPSRPGAPRRPSPPCRAVCRAETALPPGGSSLRRSTRCSSTSNTGPDERRALRLRPGRSASGG